MKPLQQVTGSLYLISSNHLKKTGSLFGYKPLKFKLDWFSSLEIKSISDEEKLAKYAALAGPAIKGAGGKFLARGIPVMTKESGEKTRTVVLEWESLEHAENGYNSEGYQEALRALDGAAIREFRYVEAAE